MKIKIKKLHPNAVIPKYAHSDDAGMDIVAVSKQETDKFIEYGSGLAFEVPEGYVMLVFPRGSITNKDMIKKNSVGVLDAGFRGELKLRFTKLGDNVYEVGERIAQIMILPFPKIEFKEVNELSQTARGKGQFGSTGTK